MDWSNISRGFTSLEVIVGIFTFSILAIGILSLASLATRLAIDSERRVVALALVNERIEFIRSLPFEQVDYSPVGAIGQEEKDVSRNQQKYDLKTEITVVDPPPGLSLLKKVEVTASWLVPGGGTRDVQVVTLVSAVPAGSSEQIACVPGQAPSGPFNYSYNDNFLDNAFAQCVANCRDASQPLPPWQCCGWAVAYTIPAGLQTVSATCTCDAPSPLPKPATDHPAPGGDEYTKLARACVDGSRCTDSQGQPKAGVLYCDANCLKEPGNCVCDCS